MPDDKQNLYLFEAIELRAEYDARIKVLRSLLPESREKRDRFPFRRDDEVRYTPAAGGASAKAAVRHGIARVRIRKNTTPGGLITLRSGKVFQPRSREAA